MSNNHSFDNELVVRHHVDPEVLEVLERLTHIVTKDNHKMEHELEAIRKKLDELMSIILSHSF